MFKKYKTAAPRVIVYRPHILEASKAAQSRHPNMPVANAQTSYGSREVVGDMLTVIALGLAVALVVMFGAASQSMSTSSHRLASTYNPNVLARPLARGPRVLAKRHVPKEVQAPAVVTTPQQIFACTGKTIMNIVAHEDDDLLFINPDISHDLARHDCIRTIYITAGDDGRGANYLKQREMGSRAAYSEMLHTTEPWVYQPVTLSSGAVVTTLSPQNNPRVSLVFFRLPDGNLNGEGFALTGYQSLARLRAGAISEITSVDGRQSYTPTQLLNTLTALIEQYRPVRINTQARDGTLAVADHSDHIATSEYVASAAVAYAEQAHSNITVRNFMGYPIRTMPSNLPATDIAEKSAAFFAYAADDPGVCTSMQICAETRSTYGFYLERQYLGN